MSKLGQESWNEFLRYRCSLAKDGDVVERTASALFSLDRLLPNYERFWWWHVVPATRRTTGDINLNAGCHATISLMAQNSYSIFSALFGAYEELASVGHGKSEDWGTSYRKGENILTQAGHAIIRFDELAAAIERPQKYKKRKYKSLNEHLTDWGTPTISDPGIHVQGPDYEKARHRAAGYRNYFVHKGSVVMTVLRDGTEPQILKVDLLGAYDDVVTWIDITPAMMSNPANFAPLRKTCETVLNDAVAFIDARYRKLCAQLQHLVTIPEYQRLWGWQEAPQTPSEFRTPLMGTTGLTSSFSPIDVPGSGLGIRGANE